MRTRRMLVGLGLLGAGLVGPADGAGADAPEATGWWARTRVGTALSPVPVPSTVPEGGLYVAGGPSGPLGVSALRLTVGPRTATELVLELESVQGTPAVRACPTSVVWPDEQGGPIESAPPAECEVVEMVGAVEDGRLRFALGALVRDGVLNVVLTPVADAVFQATFRAPGDDAVVVTDPRPAGDDHRATSPGIDDGAASPAPPTPPAADPLPPLPVPQMAAGDGTATPRDEVAFEAPRRLVEAGSVRTESNRPQVIAVLVLFDLALAYAWLRRRPVTPETARFGVGRFARERDGAVPRL